MPLYEYQCDACASKFERIQKFSDPPVEICPKCGGGVRKLLSSPAIQFKGSGWYITDYAKKSASKNDTGKSSSSSSDSASGGTSSSSSDGGGSGTSSGSESGSKSGSGSGSGS
jgi:putative FmdB family regulatory protein